MLLLYCSLFSRFHSMSQTEIVIPTVRPCQMEKNEVEPVDLVIIIDTSPSMRDEAQDLSNAAQAAITSAASSCPCDLRVAWFGIEGTWKGTHFNRTIRDYLIKECQVSDSDIRGRKRGELADAGAQEDAARAIEDICNHFNWRAGATRAIFYLGDEALEGGGDKTQEKDIIAANKAIQTAKQEGVTLHTYFGTSKSKFRDTIQTEYARLATETGGQAFSDRDAINGFAEVLSKIICNTRAVGIYLDVPQPIPCFELKSANKPLTTKGAETVTITAYNCYSNVTFKGVKVVLSAVMKSNGSPVLNLANGEPVVAIKPSPEIDFGDLTPVNNQGNYPSVSRELIIENNGEDGGEYALNIDSFYQAEFNFIASDKFEL